MSDTVIGAKVQIDATGVAAASKSIADLKDNVKQLQKEFENAKAGSTEQVTAYKNLKAAQDQLSQSTAALNKNSGDATEHFKNIKEGLTGMATGTTSAGTGVKALSAEFKALLANPVVLVITAIIGVLALLYKSFTNTFAGGEKMEQVFAGIKAAAGAVLDAIFNLGGAIIKFFSGDFKGAFEQAKSAITGVVSAATDAYSQMSKLTKQAQDLHKEQLKNDLEQAERAKQLAILREQSTDESIPVAKRKAALLELRKLSEQNAKDDIDLATKTRDNVIAINSIGTDAAEKNQDVINKAKIAAVQVETDNANELRRIGKQITQADREERAARKAEADKAAAEQKTRREQLMAFNSQLNKLQQENTLAEIKDRYAKEQAALEIKIKNDAALLKQQFDDKKITRAQYDQLENEQQIAADLARTALTDKHNDEVKANEEKFQKQLADIRQKTALAGIVDQRELEAKQLEITHAQQLAQAAKDYGADAAKLQQIKQAIDADLKVQQAKLDEKNKKEDAKKKLETAMKTASGTASDPNADFKAKKAALDADVKANDEAFKAKAISEDQYLENKRRNIEAGKELDKAELQSKLDTANAIGDAFGSLSELIGKQTAAGKAFAVAQATISAITGAVQSFTSLSAIPIVGPALGVVAAAAALAAGYANIKKIVAVQVPGQAGGGASAPSASVPAIPAAPLAPVQRSTTIDQASINDIGNAAAGGVNPIRAYIVDSDVGTAVDKNARLERSARLGGN